MMVSRSLRLACQPSVSQANLGFATSRAGSPARRGAALRVILRPVACSAAATTSATEAPLPVPRFITNVEPISRR